jgi:hypothetical protein
MPENKFTISDEVLYCYKYINVILLEKEIQKLNQLDRYILFLLCVDFYNIVDDYYFDRNLFLLSDEAQEIYDIQNDKSINSSIYIKKLQDMLGDKYMSFDKIYLKDGSELPKATSEQEAIQLRRNFNLDKIFE